MAQDTSSPPKPQSPAPEGSVKETIESILVAFILAFIFRAFVVEAFVIPTGSMGPTLMGAHMRFDCPDCGYHYDVNFPTRKNDDIPPYGSRYTDFHCPNCGFTKLRSTAGVIDTPVYFGDRILVLKYRYLFQQPAPWDVVVFKSPYEDVHDPDDPKYTENYIKRLVARPLEAVMILDGDVYIADHNEQDLTRFKIRRKPWHVQQALWRIVNDNDYIPQGLSRGVASAWQQPWFAQSGTGWTGPRDAHNSPTARRFSFENGAGAGAFMFDPDANPNTHALYDWLAYDDGPRRDAFRPVSDLKLACVYRRSSGTGPLRLQLTKRNDCFTAEFTPGKVTLLHSKLSSLDKFQTSSQEVLAQATVDDLKGSGPARLELINVDYRVSVRVNGREIVATTDAQYAPDIPRLLSEYRMRDLPNNRAFVRVEAAQQTCTIEHLSLWRDVYYLNDGTHLDATNGDSREPFWASPANVARLDADQYFVLGDNSEVSLDARYWGAPVELPREGNYFCPAGRVPGRFMLGKAFFVYWPAGYRPPSLSYGVEPDFGDMRFIH